MHKQTRPSSLQALALAIVLGAAVPAFSQVDAPYQVRYAANLQFGESNVDIVNTGRNGAPPLGPGFGSANIGNLCINVYSISPDEELDSRCSCLITPGQVVSLGVNHDLQGFMNTITGAIQTSLTIKLVGSAAGASSCSNSAALVTSANVLPGGFVAFGTTLHQTPTIGAFATTETPFVAAALSAPELASLTGRCAAILGNGSGFGVCNSCRSGATEPTITTINFEGLADSTILTNQYPGVSLSNAIVLTAGISLNELEFPPHSGTNVGADNGMPVTLTLSSPQSEFSGYFTYTSAITLTAYNAANAVVATATSKFNNNLALSGDPGSTPNEFIHLSATGITSITITSSGDFTFDDLTLVGQ